MCRYSRLHVRDINNNSAVLNGEENIFLRTIEILLIIILISYIHPHIYDRVTYLQADTKIFAFYSNKKSIKKISIRSSQKKRNEQKEKKEKNVYLMILL